MIDSIAVGDYRELNIGDLNTVNGGFNINLGWASISLSHHDGSPAIGVGVCVGSYVGQGYVILPPK